MTGRERKWRIPQLRSRAARNPAPADAGQPSLPSVIDCALYRDGVRLPDPGDYTHAYELAKQDSEPFVWLGLFQPRQAEMEEVARVFGLHELAVEDALTAGHRPKIERYGDITFFVLRTTAYVEHSELTETSEVVETGSVMMFIGPQFVVTIRHGMPGALRAIRLALEARRDRLALGPWAVAHAICDTVVDTYLEVSTLIESDVDALEEKVFAPHAAAGVAHIYQLKRELMEFKRAVMPLQRPLGILTEDRELVPKELRTYFRDVADNFNRVVDRLSNLDDLLNSILTARLAQVGVDQNNDLRKIAAWAAIAAMQTAIAGIYGMNFAFMPELHWRYGYPVVVAIMFIGAVTLYRAFRRSGWL
jgi:magnesium transporter